MELLGIPGAALIQGGATALLGVAFLLVFTGRLVPRKTFDDARADWAKQLAAEQRRGDEWSKAAEVQSARNEVLAHQVEQLLETARTTNALIEGLRQASQREKRS